MSKNTINSNFYQIVTVDSNDEPLKIKPEYLDLPASSFSGSYNDLTDKPTLGTAASANITDFATASQGAKADTAVQPEDLPTLATVATTGDYNDLINKPAPFDPTTLATVATTGSYTDLTNKPTIPTKTSELTNDSSFITGGDVQNYQAQPDWQETNTSSKSYVQNKPTLGTAASANITDFATATQGVKADTAIQTILSGDASLTITKTDTTVDIIVATAGSTTNLTAQVRNETGTTLTKGTLVYITGGAGNKALVSKALANSDATSAGTFGMVSADILNNHNGFVTITGTVSGLNTLAYPEGTVLYLSPTTAGAYTNVKPQAPNHIVYVGTVIYSHQTQGTIQTRIQNGYELDEIHDVKITSPQTGDIIKYDATLGVWYNTPDTGGGGGTQCDPVSKMDASRPISYVARGTKILKLDYTSGLVPVRSKFVTSNLEADWLNRANLTYTPC